MPPARSGGLLLGRRAVHAQEGLADLDARREREGYLEIDAAGADEGGVEGLGGVGCHDEDVALGEGLVGGVVRRGEGAYLVGGSAVDNVEEGAETDCAGGRVGRLGDGLAGILVGVGGRLGFVGGLGGGGFLLALEACAVDVFEEDDAPVGEVLKKRGEIGFSEVLVVKGDAVDG